MPVEKKTKKYPQIMCEKNVRIKSNVVSNILTYTYRYVAWNKLN